MLPIMLNISGKLCIIIGGGNAAYRKALTLLKNGAYVRVISPALCDKFNSLNIEYIKREYLIGDTKNCFLAVAATDNDKLNSQIKKDAESEGVKLFWSATDADASDIMFTAYTEFGDTKISVSTNGGFPMLGAKFCDKLKNECRKFDEINSLLSKYRREIIDKFDNDEKLRLLKKLTDTADIDDISELKKEVERIMKQ